MATPDRQYTDLEIIESLEQERLASCSQFKTVCQVHRRDGKKLWIVIRNDSDPDSVNEVTACGLPARAKDVPVGTTFETVLYVPRA